MEDFNIGLLNYASFLQSYALRLTGSRDHAGDLYQETMFRALANSNKYTPGTNLRAWAAMVMRNIFMNDCRTKKRWKGKLEAGMAEERAEHEQLLFDDDTESRLFIKQIETKISELPAMYREPFCLYRDGYRYREIAEVLTLPIGTVKSRIFLARRQLCQCLSALQQQALTDDTPEHNDACAT